MENNQVKVKFETMLKRMVGIIDNDILNDVVIRMLEKDITISYQTLKRTIFNITGETQIRNNYRRHVSLNSVIDDNELINSIADNKRVPARLKKIRTFIENYISDEKKYQSVLILRIFEGYSWDQIINELEFSSRGSAENVFRNACKLLKKYNVIRYWLNLTENNFNANNCLTIPIKKSKGYFLNTEGKQVKIKPCRCDDVERYWNHTCDYCEDGINTIYCTSSIKLEYDKKLKALIGELELVTIDIENDKLEKIPADMSLIGKRTVLKNKINRIKNSEFIIVKDFNNIKPIDKLIDNKLDNFKQYISSLGNITFAPIKPLGIKF